MQSAATYLIQGEEFYEASILLICNIEISILNEYSDSTELTVELLGNRAVYNIIQDREHSSTLAILAAFNAVLPADYRVGWLRGRVELPDFELSWRERLLEVIEGKKPLNQCLPIQQKPRYPWEYLLFRSPVEILIAKSLDKYGVLFLPNCMVRLEVVSKRENKEADFLVCSAGKWGVLEINGDTYHTNSAKDHERARLFKIHGIPVFEAYTAERSLKEPDKVVAEFLMLVGQNG